MAWPVVAALAASAAIGAIGSYASSKKQASAVKDSAEDQIAFILQQSDKATKYLDPYAAGGPDAITGLQSIAGAAPAKAEPPDFLDILRGSGVFTEKYLTPTAIKDVVRQLTGKGWQEQLSLVRGAIDKFYALPDAEKEKVLASSGLSQAQLDAAGLYHYEPAKGGVGEAGGESTKVYDSPGKNPLQGLDDVQAALTTAAKQYEAYSENYDKWVKAGESAKMPIYQPYTPFTESELAKLPETTPQYGQVPAQQLGQFFTDKFGGFDQYISALEGTKNSLPGTPQYEQQKTLLQPTDGPNAPDYTQIKQGLYQTVQAPEGAGKPSYQTLSDAAKPTYGQGQLSGFQDQVDLGRVATPGTVQPEDLSGNKVDAGTAPSLQQLTANVPNAPTASSVSLNKLPDLARVAKSDVPQFDKLGMTENFDTDNPTYRAMQTASMDELTRQGAAKGKLHSTSQDLAVAKATQANAMAILQNQQGREISEATFNQTAMDKQFQDFLSALGFNNTATALEQSTREGTTMKEAVFNSDQIQQAFANELGAIQTKQGITGFNNAAVQQQFQNGLNVAAQNLGVSKEQFQQKLAAGDQNATQALVAAGFNNTAALSEWQSKFQTADLNTKIGQANVDNAFRATSKGFQDTVDQAAFNAGVTRNQFLDGLASGNQTFAQQLQAASLNNGVTTQQFTNDVTALGKGFQDSLSKAGFDASQAMNQFTTAFQNTSANNQVLSQAFGNAITGAQTGSQITEQQAGLAGQGQQLDLGTNKQNAGLAESDYQSVVQSILQNNRTGSQAFQDLLGLADKYYNRETGQWDQGLQEYVKKFASEQGAAAQGAAVIGGLASSSQSAAGQQGAFTMNSTAQTQPAYSDLSQAAATGAGAFGNALSSTGNIGMLLSMMGLSGKLGGTPGTNQVPPLGTSAQPVVGTLLDPNAQRLTLGGYA